MDSSIDAINLANGFDPSASERSASSLASLSENFDAFLTLLTSQLQNQDPLDPMDSSEFTNQLVQFSAVEQQIQSNQNLETLIQLQNAQSAANAVGYIGKDVEVQSSQIMLQDGEAKFAYTLAESADDVVVTVTSESGQVVYIGSGPDRAGRHEFVWSGENMNGDPVADGAYEVKVTTVSGEGSPQQVQTNMIGTVDAVRYVDGQPFLTVGDLILSAADVLSVSAPTNQTQQA